MQESISDSVLEALQFKEGVTEIEEDYNIEGDIQADTLDIFGTLVNRKDVLYEHAA